MIMRRVAITGIGILSSIGNNVREVADSLMEVELIDMFVGALFVAAALTLELSVKSIEPVPGVDASEIAASLT